jgi:hypothetical protein
LATLHLAPSRELAKSASVRMPAVLPANVLIISQMAVDSDLNRKSGSKASLDLNGERAEN